MNNYFLVIAPPKSMSTAFTRALAKNSNLTTIHEPFMPEQHINSDDTLKKALQKRKQGKETEYILKLMDTITEQDIAHDTVKEGRSEDQILLYDEDIRQQIQNTQNAVVFLSISPAELFIRLFKSCMETVSTYEWHVEKEKIKGEITREADKIAKNTIKHQENISSLKEYAKEQSKKVISIPTDILRSDPHQALHKVLSTWHKLKQGKDLTLELLPITEDYNCLVNNQEIVYYLGEDSWVSESDRKKTHLEIKENFDQNKEIKLAVDTLYQASFLEGGYAQFLDQKSNLSTELAHELDEQVHEISSFISMRKSIHDCDAIEYQDFILKGNDFKEFTENLIKEKINEYFPSLPSIPLKEEPVKKKARIS